MTGADVTSQPNALSGRRVLVVEDRGLIAVKMAQILRTAGCIPVGPANTLAWGSTLLKENGEHLGAAVLDIDLRGQPVYPLAQALRERGVPILFVTGYSLNAIPEEWRATHRVEKPFDAATLIAGLEAACSGAPALPAPNPPFTGSEAIARACDTVRTARDVMTEIRIALEQTRTGKLG